MQCNVIRGGRSAAFSDFTAFHPDYSSRYFSACGLQHGMQNPFPCRSSLKGRGICGGRLNRVIRASPPLNMIKSSQTDRIKGRIMRTWQLQEAKGKFSEVVKRAQSQGPQNITVHGEQVAVLISQRDYQKLTHPKPSLVELLRASPLMGNELEISREQTPTRDINL